MEFQNKAIALDKLTTSAANVRAVGKSKAIERLATDIAHQGLIQPLTVYKDGATYRVDAGQRRLAALRILAARGEWQGPVACRVIPASASTQDREAVSYAENAGQLPMHPLDKMRILARFIRRGMDAAQIAARFGIEEAEVARVLRLQRLALPIRKSLAEGRTSEATALAYAATTDRAAQLAAFERFGPHADATMLRRILTTPKGQTSAPMTEAHRLYAFVEAEYAEAGGPLARDLFGGDNAGKVDGALVRRLAAIKLEGEAKQLAAETGAGWIEVCIERAAYSDHPEWNHATEGDCPVPLGVSVWINRHGVSVHETGLVRLADWHEWEEGARAEVLAASEDDDTPEAFAPDADDDTPEAFAPDADDDTPEADPEAEPRAPSRPMNRAAEDAASVALQQAVAGSFDAALDAVLHVMLNGSTRAALEAHFGTGNVETPDWLADMMQDFGSNVWGLIDAMTPDQKRACFAYHVGDAMRANTDRYAIDRDAPSDAARVMAGRVRLNMHEAWESEARREYLGKMSKFDLVHAVLGLKGDEAKEAMQNDKPSLVEWAHEAHWLPAYFAGMDHEDAAPAPLQIEHRSDAGDVALATAAE